MRIIPVIDILNGQAVHARKGERNLYQPVNSPLCPDPRPSAVINSYLLLFPFDTFYLADLNAIMDKGDNRRLIQELLRDHPERHFWIDAGRQSMAYAQLHGALPVTGTETGITVYDLKTRRDKNGYILSLDFMNGDLIGDPELLAHSEYWPERIIIMSLNKVGSRSGPDLEFVASIQTLVPDRQFYIAGGVRDRNDLARLAETGIHGALVASALHEQSLVHNDLVDYENQAKKTPG